MKPTITLDFDTPINPYSLGWQGGKIYDEQPQHGASEAIKRLAKKYRIVVTTARTDLAPVHEALERWGLDKYVADVGNTKVPSVAYIDDKAVAWRSWDQALNDLKNLTGEDV